MGYKVYGRVRRSDNGQGILNMSVRAYDVDWISSDDYLGIDITDTNGYFEILFDEDDFDAGWFDIEGGPDIVLKVYSSTGHLVYVSEERSGAGDHTYFDIRISPEDILGRYTVSGTVRDVRSGRSLCNLRTEAWDDDFIFDDLLGVVQTNVNGHYDIVYDRSDFSGWWFENQPDVYVKVKNNDGLELARSWTREEAPNHAYIDVDVGSVEISRSVSECIFGWTAAYQQAGTHIIVRLQLNPDTNVTTQEIQTLQNTWKQGIENKWSNHFACCCNMSAVTTWGCSNWSALTFEVQWVTTNPHHTVRVRRGPTRTNMTTWDTQDTGDVASHEFGHMLGLVDEYSDSVCPARSPVNTGTVMDDNTEVVEHHVEHLCRLLNENAVPIVHLVAIEKILKLEAAKIRTVKPIMVKEILKDREAILTHLKKIVNDEEKPDKKLKITHRISGGAPTKRIEWVTEIDGDGEALHRIKDELKGKEEKYSAKFTLMKIKNLLKDVQDTKLLELKETGGQFLPDSLIGTITIEIDDKSTTYYYLVDPEQRKEQNVILKQAVAIIDRDMRRFAEVIKKRDIETGEKINSKVGKD